MFQLHFQHVAVLLSTPLLDWVKFKWMAKHIKLSLIEWQSLWTIQGFNQVSGFVPNCLYLFLASVSAKSVGPKPEPEAFFVGRREVQPRVSQLGHQQGQVHQHDVQVCRTHLVNYNVYLKAFVGQRWWCMKWSLKFGPRFNPSPWKSSFTSFLCTLQKTRNVIVDQLSLSATNFRLRFGRKKKIKALLNVGFEPRL